MAGEFVVNNFKNMGGTTILVSGKVESGEVAEGDIGKTFKGKKFAVIKIEKNEKRVAKIYQNDQAVLSVKYILPADLVVGQSLLF